MEEILPNAVYHRSCQIPEPIVVRLTPESMEMTSYPGFGRSTSDKDIARYHIQLRICRDRRIGDFLKELHLIEGRNTGFPTAFRSLELNGSPLPIFQMDENRSYLSAMLPVHPAFAPHAGQRLKAGTDELAERIFEVLPSEPVLISELARLLGCKSASKRLRAVVDMLVESGKLVSIPSGGRNFCQLQRIWPGGTRPACHACSIRLQD